VLKVAISSDAMVERAAPLIAAICVADSASACSELSAST